MTAALAFIKLFWKPLLAVAIGLAILFALRHYGDVRYAAGRQQAVSEQTAAAAKKAIENAQKERDDAKRIADAYKARDESEAQLAAIRARPVPALVCHRAPSRPGGMPASTGVPDAPAANTGALPDGGGEGFDPAPAVIAMADEADSLLADCRMLHQAVHGIPTAR